MTFVKEDSLKYAFYYLLSANMMKHNFLSKTLLHLNELILSKDEKLDLSTLKCSENDNNKLLNHPDFEFYREYIKINTK
jgi:hypothetical protein